MYSCCRIVLLCTLLTYLCLFARSEHRPSTKERHCFLSVAIFSISFQVYPISFVSFSVSLCQVFRGLPLLLFPGGVCYVRDRSKQSGRERCIPFARYTCHQLLRTSVNCRVDVFVFVNYSHRIIVDDSLSLGYSFPIVSAKYNIYTNHTLLRHMNKALLHATQFGVCLIAEKRPRNILLLICCMPHS